MDVAISKDSVLVYVLDNDQTVDSNNKKSVVKIYSLKQDTISLIDVWNWETFGLEDEYPINDFEINYEQSAVFVTLGNYGLGYGKFIEGKINSPNNIQLSNIPEIKSIFLASSFFKEVEFVSFSQEDA